MRVPDVFGASRPDQNQIANTETAFRRSFCLARHSSLRWRNIDECEVFEKSAKHGYRSVCVLGTRAISHAQSLEPNRVINRGRCRDGRLALALVQGSGTSTRILTAPHLAQSQSTIFRAKVLDSTVARAPGGLSFSGG